MSNDSKIIHKRIVHAYLSSVTSTTLVLFVIGIAAMLLVNTRVISNYFRENLKFSVILRQEVKEKSAQDLEKTLQKMPQVRSTEYISKEQGALELSEILGEEFLDLFETSPIPISIDVNLTADCIKEGGAEEFRAKLEKMPQVEEVVYQKSLVDALNKNLNRISIVLAVLIALMLFVSFVLIGNTVRLSIYARRFTIRTMTLVGATPSFIRKPFMAGAFFQGIYSALFAIMLLVGGLYLLRRAFEGLASVFTLDLLLQVMAVMVVCGISICLISTFSVTGKLLRSKLDDLYY